jgi:DNA polymerase
MVSVEVHDFASWRTSARQMLRANVAPADVHWTSAGDTQQILFAETAPPPDGGEQLRVPDRFLKLARIVACHRDPARWGLLYRALFRIVHGERALLDIEVDEDTRALVLMDKAVRQDIHHMHAFVRFRKVASGDTERFVAWYRPDHYIVELAAPFFKERFGAMEWAILTPDRSVYWDRKDLRFGPGLPQAEAPAADKLEDLWCDYYSSIFNPARVNVKVLKAELPVRHWQTLPESRVIAPLIATAPARTLQMIESAPASSAPFVPGHAGLSQLREAVRSCRGCELYRCATQPVFGVGPENARVLLVGEQPGDQEDLTGLPFVGPAGQLLDRALSDAGVDRGDLYITNAVKHFKYVERGKRRLHQTPRGPEISACRPWVEAEIDAVKPDLIVCLGGTAAQSLMGKVISVNRARGVFSRHHLAQMITVTLHPSALLRTPDPDLRAREYSAYVEDFRRIKETVVANWGHFRRAA